LGISQPSLSQQLKIFEEEVGKSLFVRKGRTFDLSTRGRALYEESRGLFDIADSISSHVKVIDPGREITFRVGVSSDIERPFVAEVIGQILRTRRAKNIKFEVISKEHKEIAADFRSGDIELVITNSKIADRPPAYDFSFPVFLVTSKVQKNSRSLNESNLKAIFQSLEEDLIIPSEGHVLRFELDRFLSKISSHPQVVFESNILACVIRAIQEGVGCSFLPKPYVQKDLKRGILSAIGPQKGYWQHRVSAYVGKRADEVIVKGLMQVIQDYCI
jgi:LysR family transcriptional activator of nhaA